MNSYSSYDSNVSGNGNHNLYDSLASVELQRPKKDSSNRPLSTQNLVHVLENHHNNSGKSNHHGSINNDIVTIDHNDADASFILPNFLELPEEIRVRVMDNLVDIPTMVSLEETKRLNWWVDNKLSCAKLYPLVTSGDGNCLLHATSLAMWGFHDHSLSMRKALNETLITSKPNNSLYRRWRWAQSVQNKKYGLVFSEQEWSEEWSSLLKLSSAEPRISQRKSSDLSPSIDETSNSKSSQMNTDQPTKSSTQSTRQYYESLEEFHVYVLANNIRRPIIIYSDTILRTNDGEAISPIEFGGIYLPLEIPPEKCHKQPIFLAFDAAHFSALLLMEQNTNSISKVSYRIPLIDTDTFDILPIHFLIDPGLNFQWPIDKELSDDNIHFYTNCGENRMDILEKYLDLSREYISPNDLLLPCKETKYNDRISTTNISVSNGFNTPKANKKRSRSSLNLFSKLFRRKFIEAFSSNKRLSNKHSNHHNQALNDTSNLPIISEHIPDTRRCSPLFDYETNILTVILTNFQPKRPKTSDNMIKTFIDKCMNEYQFEKSQQLFNNENESRSKIESFINSNEVNPSRLMNNYPPDAINNTSVPNHRYSSLSGIKPYYQDVISTNASIETSEALNGKEVKRKLPPIPTTSPNKTIPSSSSIDKNPSIDDLLPMGINQTPTHNTYAPQNSRLPNQLAQNNSSEMTHQLEYHLNKHSPSQQLISSSLKRQQSASSDKNSTHPFENSQQLNDFLLTTMNNNKRTQILNSISNLTQQKRF